MSAPQLVLGVDAGGTKTDMALVDRSGTMVAAIRTAGANHEALGWAGSRSALGDALNQVLRAADAQHRDVGASAWGLAGLDWAADEVSYRSIVEAFGLNGQAMIVNDAFLALELGPAPAVGVGIVAGTGMIAVGRGPDGELYRTLGVGAGRGDWGSGHDVTRAALEAVAHQHMGLGPDTALTARALNISGAANAGDYCELAWRSGNAALISPDVWDVAEAGDQVAMAIADRVADSLAAGAGAVAQRLGLIEAGCDVVLAGRVLDPGSPVLHERLVAALAEQLPGSRPRRLGVLPVAGAVAAASRLGGLEADHLSAIDTHFEALARLAS